MRNVLQDKATAIVDAMSSDLTNTAMLRLNDELEGLIDLAVAQQPVQVENAVETKVLTLTEAITAIEAAFEPILVLLLQIAMDVTGRDHSRPKMRTRR